MRKINGYISHCDTDYIVGVVVNWGMKPPFFFLLVLNLWIPFFSIFICPHFMDSPFLYPYFYRNYLTQNSLGMTRNTERLLCLSIHENM